jgi:hypothetical protein
MVAGALSTYFQCSEIDGAKWQILLKKFLSRFQIETRFLVMAGIAMFPVE